VDAVAFLGSVVRMVIRLGESAVTLDVLNTRGLALPKVGSDVAVSFPSQASWILAER
jgi:hypothetical protein